MHILLTLHKRTKGEANKENQCKILILYVNWYNSLESNL